MRFQGRFVLGLYALALAVPSWVVAAPPDDDESGAPATAAAPHKHKGLFGWRHCVECQRAYVKAHDGVDVPPPPSLAPVAGMQGQVVVGPGGNCLTCQGTPAGPGMVVGGNPGAPGYAMVGGPAGAQGAPGYAVVGDMTGADPTPIGVAQNRPAAWVNPQVAGAGMRAGAGPYDPAVVQSSLPPAQTALEDGGHNHPHIIRHLLGIPEFGQRRRQREDKEREKHAAIAYGQPGAPVTELPVSMVYGKGTH
jgi:hypothetical protein